MTKDEGRRNVWLYQLYVVFNEPLFWGPILIAALQKLAYMSLSEIYYMEAVVIGICVLLDVPFGVLADTIGRKKTIILGRCFLFGSVFFFATMSSSLEAWIGNILWAIGYTLQSGADTALFYDTLKENGEESDYKRIEGRALGFRFALVAVCSLLAGLFASVNLRLPLYISMPFVLIPLISSFFLTEPVPTGKYSARNQFAILKQGWIFMLHSRKIRWMIGFAALLASASKVWFFTYNPYFEAVRIKIEYYGLIFFLLNLVAWLSSHYAYKVEAALGERGCIVFMTLCIGVPILLMGLVPIWPFAYLVLIQNLVRGFMRPFVGDYLNKHISANIRATALSINSSVTNFAAIFGLAVFGFLIGELGLLASLNILGLLVLILGTWSFGAYRKIVVVSK